MNKTKIIVTGGTGYIGTHTVVELLHKGFEVAIIDNLSNSSQSVLDSIEQITGARPLFYEGDLRKESDCFAFFEQHQDAVAVIHFAALKSVGESVDRPILYYDNNINSTLNLLEMQIEFEIPYLIFSSSATVYGACEELPVKEDSPLIPASSPYGKTKQINEVIIEDAFEANQLLKAAISLRYFNPVGAHPSGLLGELPNGRPNNLMPVITQTAAGVLSELKVFGSDYDTPDGTAVRDYIHVVDLAKAHVLAVERLLQEDYNQIYEVFNLGTGKGYSVLEVIQSFEKVSGIDLNYRIVERRAGDIPAIYADPTMAKEVLGWKAEKELDDMTASAWNWEKSIRK